MVYLVTNQQELYDSDKYKIITVEESLEIMKDWKVIQYDSETSGLNCFINHLLSIQFGTNDIQIVVDCTTIDIIHYKDILESRMLVGHNLKFDLPWLYNFNIIPTNVFDTMIVEQLLHLGYPHGIISYSLKAVAKKYLDIELDKSIRGQIIWKGLTEDTIIYAANDVKYLEDIMRCQIIECNKKQCTKGAKLECDFVPVIAYLEWCGIKLDKENWRKKMKIDLEGLNKSKKALDDFVIRNNLSKYYTVDLQGDLFSGFNLDPVCTINWDSSKQVVELAKDLGFNTTVQDKKTGENKDSVIEKHLKSQKGINDEFLDLYFKHQEYAKVVSSFGQGHLNIINPKTGRIHTNYNQLGASSGRMSCGGGEDKEIAKLRKIPSSQCKLVNIQQLPADEPTRSSFVSEEGNMFCSCDFSAMESYLGADIYNDKAFQDEFLYGSKDTHSLFAWMVFRKECEELGCKSVADVKKLAPQWRKKVKAVEFAYMFGAAAPTIANSANCDVETAQGYIDKLNSGFKGISKFANEGSKFVRKNGYVLLNKYTGHKMYWWDFKHWQEVQQSFTSEFWDTYRLYHKGTGDNIAQMVREHFQAASKWDRMARNGPTQGSGACITKLAATYFFKWIVKYNFFGKIKLVAMVHDEICIEYPKELSKTADVLKYCMEKASTAFCKFSKIPAAAEVSNHWVH